MSQPHTIAEDLSAHRITLRDGVELVADVFVGKGASPGPAILELTPYGRGRERPNFSYEAPYWVRHGYALVIVECRGTGDSDGEFRFFIGDGDDGHDVVEWIARQPWCNGSVGMRGASYSGTNQWHVARTRPPSLRAIVPNASGWGRDDIVYDGGMFHLNWALSWPMDVSGAMQRRVPDFAACASAPLKDADLAALGQCSALYQHFLDHPPSDDAYWQPFDFTTEDYASIDIPVLAFSGWFDGTLRGTLEHDRRRRAASRSRTSTHLIIGAWEHGSCSDGGYSWLDGKPIDRIGDLKLPPQAMCPGLALTRQFFDTHLKGEGRFEQPAVSLYITGSDCWIATTSFPPPQAHERALYLHSGGQANALKGDGRLTWKAPAREPADTYRSDPARPVPNTLGDLTGAPPGLGMHGVDMAPLIDRPDVLVYVSPAMDKPLTVVGDVRLTLHVEADVADADFVCRLEDVAPDGTAIRLGSRECGVARARWREGFEQEVLLAPGVPARVTLRLGGIGHTFVAGHRLRLSVTGSAYPRHPVNPHTGGPLVGDTAAPRVATVKLLHEAAHPSHLLLPCIDLD